MIRSIHKLNVSRKKVLLRLDFDIPLEESLPTIKFLLEHEARLIILIGSLEDAKASTHWVANRLKEVLQQPVHFWPESLGGRELPLKLKSNHPQGVLVLENLNAYLDETENSLEFGKGLAALGDVYVNEAFSLSQHRWASLIQTPKFLPRAAGLNFFKEVKMLTIKKPEPVVAISGGEKILESLEFISRSLEKNWDVLVGGRIADIILRVKGVCPGKAWPIAEAVRLIKPLELTNPKLHLPVDAVVSPDYTGADYTRISALGKIRKEEDVLDVGPATIEMFSQVIQKAKTIIWHGPLGFCEQPTFNHGTRKIALAITKNIDSYKIVGGENTINFLKSFGLEDKMSFISQGGLAMMDLVTGKTLPAIQALETKLKTTYDKKN